MRRVGPKRHSASVRRSLAAVLVAGAVWLGAAAGSAQATDYKVTFVARVCPAYTDIFANLARNNIQESLKDLGPDSPYLHIPDFRVSPTVEDGLDPQKSACTDLPNWQFTLGHAIAAGASTGPWGSLSIVTGVFDRPAITTLSSTALLDQNGQQIGNQTIAGAVTITLTADELKQAQGPGTQLWAQGGTPDDPVLDQRYPGQYGFGALRCAVDALNGDNVEYIYFPEGVTHVFCYALYVKPPPTSGTITIKKVVTGAPAGDNPSFPFNGTPPNNLSFDPNGFTLRNGQSDDFFRAGGVTWNVTEGGVANYTLDHISCTPGSSVTIDGATVFIHLTAGEHVTCVYTNRFVPPHGGLTIRKVTLGGVGTFAYLVSPTSAPQRGRRAVATTTEPGVAADAEPSPLDLPPGSYRIRERRPTSPDGRWRLVGVRCNGQSRSRTRPFVVEITSGASVVCTFVNRFIPRGSISISKITEGGTGTATFKISPTTGSPASFLQTATTTAPGTPADATPKTPADATDRLRLGHYVIVEQPPLTTSGEWLLTSVVCDGLVVPFAQGAVEVTLTRTNPHVHCVFTDAFSAAPTPPPPPNPEPVPPPPGPPGPPQPPTPAPDYQIADLAVTKVAAVPAVTRGGVATFHLTVRNIGPDSAEDVMLVDQPRGSASVVSIRPSRGSCQTSPRIICRLGTLAPGARVTITVRMRVHTGASAFSNRAVVGTATLERTLDNNVAHAAVRVVGRSPAPPPSVTG